MKSTKIQELSSQIKREYKLRQTHHSNPKQTNKSKKREKLKSNIQEYNVTTRRKILQITHEFTRHTKTYQEWISKSPNQMANHRIHESKKQA